MTTPKPLQIFTDGSCWPNPGPGGWAVIVLPGMAHPIKLSGARNPSTNNEMELTAVLKAMEWIRDNGSPRAVIHSDSQYCVNTITQWAPKWERRGWIKDSGPIKNLELIKEMMTLYRSLPHLSLQWVKGHANNAWNIMADELAGKAMVQGVMDGMPAYDPPPAALNRRNDESEFDFG